MNVSEWMELTAFTNVIFNAGVCIGFLVSMLKGDSTNFTHQIQFIGLWLHYSACEKSCLKAFVAAEGTVQSQRKSPEWHHKGYFLNFEH